jgi:hypothetical protein
MIPFWDVTPCRLVGCFQIVYIEIEGDTFLREAGKTLPLPNTFASQKNLLLRSYEDLKTRLNQRVYQDVIDMGRRLSS